jgi:hypothetical protein
VLPGENNRSNVNHREEGNSPCIGFIAPPSGHLTHTLSYSGRAEHVTAAMLITLRVFFGAMARAEQIVTDRRTMREMVVFMEEAVKEGLAREEITSQIDLMLDKAAKRRLERSLKEARRGKVKHFKSKDELPKTLRHVD